MANTRIFKTKGVGEHATVLEKYNHYQISHYPHRGQKLPFYPFMIGNYITYVGIHGDRKKQQGQQDGLTIGIKEKTRKY